MTEEANLEVVDDLEAVWGARRTDHVTVTTPQVFTTGLRRHYDGTWETWVRRDPGAPKAADPIVLVAGAWTVPVAMLVAPPDDGKWHLVSWTIEETPVVDHPTRRAWARAREDAIRFTREQAGNHARRLRGFGADLWEARWNNTVYVAEVIGAMIKGLVPFDRATYEAGWNTIRRGVAA